MISIFRCMVAVCSSVCLFAAVGAQEVVLDNFSGMGARAMGMGGAYTAISDDFSGLFWNPAGLARIRRGEVYTAFSHERFRNEAVFFGAPAENRFSSTRLNAVGITVPYPVYRGSLVFAGGYGRTGSFNGGVRIDGYDPVARFEKTGISEDSGALGAYVAGGAVDVAPGVSLGMAVQRWQGRNQFHQELTRLDTEQAHGDTVRLYERFASRDRFSAWGIRSGLLYVNPAGFRFGITVTAPMNVRVHSQMEDEYEDVFEDRVENYPVEQMEDAYAIKSPFEFAVGVAWSGGVLTLSGDVQYGDLQQATYGELPVATVSQVENFRTQYRSVLRSHLGAEFWVQNLALRVGYYRDPIRYVGGEGLADIQVVQDRDVLTVGVGGSLEKAVLFDVAAVVGGYRQIEGGREDHVRTVRVFASMGYQFNIP